MINDLKRYRIKALLVDDYRVITDVLKEIENRFKKKTIFISGSAEEYGSWDRDTSQGFIHLLSKNILSKGYTVVNGFGWGIGSAIINGALEAIFEKPERISYDQLVMRPFPQFRTGKKDLQELWEDYRQSMISLAGITIIIFGNKKDALGKTILAQGVKREFEIAIEQGLIPIPISTTGYMASEIYNEILLDFPKYYKGVEWVIPMIESLNKENISSNELIGQVINIIQDLNK